MHMYVTRLETMVLTCKFTTAKTAIGGVCYHLSAANKTVMNCNTHPYY